MVSLSLGGPQGEIFRTPRLPLRNQQGMLRGKENGGPWRNSSPVI